MGTRADFYVGHGQDAEWLGSVAWDGHGWYDHKTDMCDAELSAADADTFRSKVAAILNGREDSTLPEDGWPWPWDDSHKTNYAYVFADGCIHVYCFGRPAGSEDDDGPKTANFPDMSARKNVTFGPRSGVFIFVSK